jgi:hypothetical protein
MRAEIRRSIRSIFFNNRSVIVYSWYVWQRTHIELILVTLNFMLSGSSLCGSLIDQINLQFMC